jgi:hypothetical protein
MKNWAATLTGQMVGRTPWSARDALVPLQGQRYQHHADRQQADGDSPPFVNIFFEFFFELGREAF